MAEGSLGQPLPLLWTLPCFPVLDNRVYRRQEGRERGGGLLLGMGGGAAHAWGLL